MKQCHFSSRRWEQRRGGGGCTAWGEKKKKKKKGGGSLKERKKEEEEEEEGHSRIKSNCSYRALFEDVIGQGNAVTCSKGLRDFTVYWCWHVLGQRRGRKEGEGGRDEWRQAGRCKRCMHVRKTYLGWIESRKKMQQGTEEATSFVKDAGSLFRRSDQNSNKVLFCVTSTNSSSNSLQSQEMWYSKTWRKKE